MAYLNEVTIIGNLGRDPEIRSFPDGGTVCNLTVATTRRWKVCDSQEVQEETEWHRIVFRNQLADIVAEHFRKGYPIYVRGRLKTRKWQDKEGRDNYTTEIIGEQFQFLQPRQQQDEGGSGRQERAPTRNTPARQPAASAGGGGFDDMDDDIPF